MASTTYIDLQTEAIQVQELVVFLTRLDTDGGNERLTDYKQLVSNGQLSACMSKLAAESDLLFAKANDADLVSFFALFSTLLLKLGKDIVEELLPKVIQKISAAAERKQVRLQILADIFNLDPNSVHRVKVLNAVFRYAAETDQLDVVQHHTAALDEWIFELKLDNAGARALIGSILPGLQNSPYADDRGKTDLFSESRELFIRFLSSFSEGDQLTPAEEALIQKILIEFMKSPNTETIELDEVIDCPILSALKGYQVYQLLEIFAKGNVQQFKEFTDKNQSFLTESGIDADVSAHSISLAAFARVCASKRVVTYAEVADTLQVSEDEVEPIVIDAVMQGLVDARLEQPEKTILVRYARQRNYDAKEWTQLSQRVDAFKTNIQDLIKVIEEAKQSNLQRT